LHGEDLDTPSAAYVAGYLGVVVDILGDQDTPTRAHMVARGKALVDQMRGCRGREAAR
jgi:hypothetical protein